MEMEKVSYSAEDLKMMMVNSKQMIDLCNAKDKRAFAAVQNHCKDLEKVSPSSAQELKRKALLKQQMYDKTKNPSLFAELVNDIQELYGRAFKLMIENMKRNNKNKAPVGKESFHKIGPVHNEGTLENAMAEKEEQAAVQNAQQSQPQPKPAVSKVQLKNKPEFESVQEQEPLFGNATKGKGKNSQVERISFDELEKAQNEMNTQQVQNINDDELMRKYNERIKKKLDSGLNSSKSGQGLEAGLAREMSGPSAPAKEKRK